MQEEIVGEAYDVAVCEEKSTFCYSYYSCSTLMEIGREGQSQVKLGTTQMRESFFKVDQRHFWAGAGGDCTQTTALQRTVKCT